MEQELTALLAGARRMDCGGGMQLRLLSAMEVLEARREAAALVQEGREQALCANACLLARALERKGKPVFQDGQAVLRGLTAGQIAALAGQWAEFDRRENPSPEDGTERIDALKKAWSTRPLRAFAGACSGLLARCRPRREHGR